MPTLRWYSFGRCQHGELGRRVVTEGVEAFFQCHCRIYIYIYIYIYTYTYIYIYMMQGCHTPPPPPTPWYPPLPVIVGSCLVWPCFFPRLVLFGLVPSPPCGVGPLVFLVGPAPPVGAVCSTGVWYGCCRLLVVRVTSSLHALSPPRPVGRGLWSFWLAPPRLCGAVCSTEIWYGCCRLLAVMSSLRARYHTKYDVALFSLQTVPLSLL